MTVLTAVQVADYWIGAAGPRGRAVEWVAIAIGESSLDDSAVSPVGAIGLWQIMPFNAPTYGYSPADLYDPAVNAHVAVAMSGGGINCAAWDSAYLDIEASGRYTYLAWPEVGSADYDNLATAAAELQGQGLTGTSAAPPPAVPDTLANTVHQLQQLAGSQLPGLSAALAPVAAEMQGMYKRGWRP